MEFVQAITNEKDLVNICDLYNFNFQIHKEMLLNEQEEIKHIMQSICELPKFAEFVRGFEIVWKKRRQDFNIFEKDYVHQQYAQIYQGR
jgi:hypothetical protein